MVLGSLWDIPSLRLFKELRNPPESLDYGSPSLSSTHSSNCVLYSLIIEFHLLLPYLDNTIKEHDFCPMSSDPKHLFFPLANCLQSSTCCVVLMLTSFDLQIIIETGFPIGKEFQATHYNHCVCLTQYCSEGFCQLNSSVKH